MADFTTTKTWNVGDTLAAADMNTYVRDNTQCLYDNAVLLLDKYEVTTTDVSTITFDSISGDYSFLELRIWAQGGTSSTAKLSIRANNDTSTDSYEAIRYYTTNGSWDYNLYNPNSQFLYSVTLPNQDNTNEAGQTTCRIYGYADTNHYTVLEGSVVCYWPDNYAQQYAGMYKSTDAVTSLDISLAGGFAVGSKISLYGYR